MSLDRCVLREVCLTDRIGMFWEEEHSMEKTGVSQERDTYIVREAAMQLGGQSLQRVRVPQGINGCLRGE